MVIPIQGYGDPNTGMMAFVQGMGMLIVITGVVSFINR